LPITTSGVCFYGAEASKYLEANASKLKQKEFYSSVRKYYTAACEDYMISKFLYQDEVLIHPTVAVRGKKFPRHPCKYHPA